MLKGVDFDETPANNLLVFPPRTRQQFAGLERDIGCTLEKMASICSNNHRDNDDDKTKVEGKAKSILPLYVSKGDELQITVADGVQGAVQRCFAGKSVTANFVSLEPTLFRTSLCYWVFVSVLILPFYNPAQAPSPHLKLPSPTTFSFPVFKRAATGAPLSRSAG